MVTVSAKGVQALAAHRERKKIADNIDDELADEMAACYLDPYRFVLMAFDWGRGELEKHQGPDKWQTKFLKDIRDTLQEMREDEVSQGYPRYPTRDAGRRRAR